MTELQLAVQVHGGRLEAAVIMVGSVVVLVIAAGYLAIKRGYKRIDKDSQDQQDGGADG